MRRSPALQRQGAWATTDTGCLLAADGLIVRASAALLALLGFSPNQVEGQLFTALTHPDDAGAVASALGWVRGDASPLRFECRWRHGDGTWHWLEWQVAHYRGHPHRTAVARDITRWRQEEEVALGQVRVLEAIATGRGRDDAYTQLCALIEGIGPEVRGGVYEVDAERGTLRLVAASVRTFADSLPSETPLSGPPPEGLWIEPAIDFQGTTLGAVGAMLGESRTAGARERQILQLAAQLLTLAYTNEQSDGDARRLARAVENISDLLVVFAADRQRTVRYVNDAFSRHTGYRLGEVLGHPFPDLAGPESDPVALARIGEALAAGRPVREELLAYTKAGKPIWLDLSLAPIQDDRGVLIEWAYTARDISERKATERESGRSGEAGGPVRAARAGRVSDAASAVIAGAGDVAGSAGQAGERWGRSRDSDTASGRVSYPPVASVTPVPPDYIEVAETINLSELVLGMRHLLAAAVPAATTLSYQLEEHLPPVSGSADLLRQLVLGLVSHAAHGLDQGAGEISLCTRIFTTDLDVPSTAADGDALRPGSYVALEATDTGRGMEEAAAALALDPHLPVRASGRGLGVTAVLGIVRAHRGLIRVLRSPETGTTLRILLPVVNGNGRAERRTR